MSKQDQDSYLELILRSAKAQDWRTPAGNWFTPFVPGRERLRIGWVTRRRGFGGCAWIVKGFEVFEHAEAGVFEIVKMLMVGVGRWLCRRSRALRAPPYRRSTGRIGPVSACQSAGEIRSAGSSPSPRSSLPIPRQRLRIARQETHWGGREQPSVVSDDGRPVVGRQPLIQSSSDPSWQMTGRISAAIMRATAWAISWRWPGGNRSHKRFNAS
jgi:hypothetical protein